VAARKYVVGKAGDLDEGERMLVEVNGRQIVIFRHGGAFYGLLNRCPHRGASLCEGRFIANITSTAVGTFEFHGESRLLACPWHGWEFDVRTGQSYFDPAGVRARPFEVGVERGDALMVELEAGEAGLAPAEHPAGSAGERRPGPYRAETFDVTVEDDYLVVSMRPPRPSRTPAAAAPTGR
jgi:3-phenylpropionate/trans-cinnamate dioxygenase ferredoxin subunit